MANLFMGQEKITIDAIEGISVDRVKYRNQLEMLEHLNAGLKEIYFKFKEIENKVFKENARPVQAYSIGVLHYISHEFYSVLPCYFHWFSITINNYARLVAYLKGRELAKIKKETEHLTKQEAEYIKQQGGNLDTEYKNKKVERDKIKRYCNL